MRSTNREPGGQRQAPEVRTDPNAPSRAGCLGLAGDWHGNAPWALASLQELATVHSVRTVLHLGDFGIWPGNGGRKYLDRIERQCARLDVTVLITPGNHEDWGQINACLSQQRDAFGSVKWFRPHIAVLPRGHRFSLSGRSFVSLGGAPSVDFEARTPGADWWPEEMITRAEAEAVAAGGHADVMLTHDSPDKPWWTPAVAHICGTNPLGWSQTALSYAAVGRNRITTAVEGVRPELLIHGHYHVADEALVEGDGAECRLVSLGRDGGPGNLALLDLRTLSVGPIPLTT